MWEVLKLTHEETTDVKHARKNSLFKSTRCSRCYKGKEYIKKRVLIEF